MYIQTLFKISFLKNEIVNCHNCNIYLITKLKMNFRPFSDRASFESTAGTIGAAFSKFYKPLFYFAFEQLQNKARAEDAVATAFLECWKNISDDPEIEVTASRMEDDLYGYAQYYCHRHLNQLYRDRVLSDIFNKESAQERLILKCIEAKVIHQLRVKIMIVKNKNEIQPRNRENRSIRN